LEEFDAIEMGLLSAITRAFELPRAPRCETCKYFRNDPAYIEAAFRGLTSFSSGYASARAEDGLCTQHDMYLSADCYCPRYLRADPFTAKELSIR
jgi:hypothetical protein